MLDYENITSETNEIHGFYEYTSMAPFFWATLYVSSHKDKLKLYVF